MKTVLVITPETKVQKLYKVKLSSRATMVLAVFNLNIAISTFSEQIDSIDLIISEAPTTTLDYCSGLNSLAKLGYRGEMLFVSRQDRKSVIDRALSILNDREKRIVIDLPTETNTVAPIAT